MIELITREDVSQLWRIVEAQQKSIESLQLRVGILESKMHWVAPIQPLAPQWAPPYTITCGKPSGNTVC